VGIVIYCLLPFYWMVVSALRRPTDQFRNTVLPTHWSLANVKAVFQPGVGFGRNLLNSVIVAGGTTILTLVVGTFAAYALARLEFRGKNLGVERVHHRADHGEQEGDADRDGGDLEVHRGGALRPAVRHPDGRRSHRDHPAGDRGAALPAADHRRPDRRWGEVAGRHAAAALTSRVGAAAVAAGSGRRARATGPTGSCHPGGVSRRSERPDVVRLWSLLALDDLELDPLVLLQRPVPGHLDRGEVGEDVGPAAVRGDEPVALLRVEPLDRALRHSAYLSSSKLRPGMPPDATITVGNPTTEADPGQPPAGRNHGQQDGTRTERGPAATVGRVDLVEAEARRRFAAARVARLATVAADGRPHLVPVTFAVRGDVLVTAVDHKPKRTTRL